MSIRHLRGTRKNKKNNPRKALRGKRHEWGMRGYFLSQRTLNQLLTMKLSNVMKMQDILTPLIFEDNA